VELAFGTIRIGAAEHGANIFEAEPKLSAAWGSHPHEPPQRASADSDLSRLQLSQFLLQIDAATS